MAQSKTEQLAPFNLTAADIAAETKKRIQQFANAQTQQLANLQAANRLWLDRIRRRSIQQ